MQNNEFIKDKDSKYSKSSLTSEMCEKYSQKLANIIAEEKPFLDSEITLPKLAKKLSISTHHLSQILNQQFNQSFFDFINSHRINEAKILLKKQENKNIKIIEIGFMVGYNSVSSFNKSFKKNTAITPSQYRDKIISS